MLFQLLVCISCVVLCVIMCLVFYQDGKTAMMWAQQFGRTDCVEFLRNVEVGRKTALRVT